MSEYKNIATDPNICPLPVRAAIDRFIKDGLLPGGFVTAILENDLLEAINRADSVNIRWIPSIVAYMAEHVPPNARGSTALVAAHIARKWKTNGTD